MALPVVESYSAGAYAVDGASCVVTKPTGLAVGNLMIASGGSQIDTGSAPNIGAPAGWTEYASYAGETFAKVWTFYKVADSADVAASNFTFTSNGSTNTRIIVGIARISGAVSLTSSATDTKSSTATPAFSVSLDLVYSDALILFQIMGRDPTVGNYSAYTTSGTNPTWTEQMDVTNSDSVDTAFAVASAGIATPRTLTSFGATNSNNIEDHYLLVVVIPAQLSTTGTATLHSADADFFAPAGFSGTTGTNTLLSADADFFSTSGEGIVPTVWTPITKS